MGRREAEGTNKWNLSKPRRYLRKVTFVLPAGENDSAYRGVTDFPPVSLSTFTSHFPGLLKLICPITFAQESLISWLQTSHQHRKQGRNNVLGQVNRHLLQGNPRPWEWFGNHTVRREDPLLRVSRDTHTDQQSRLPGSSDLSHLPCEQQILLIPQLLIHPLRVGLQ